MYSFKIVDGDLAMGGDGNPRTIEGAERIAQDLSCWTLEPLGTDPHYPRFGSDLDTRIGSPLDSEALQGVRSEVMRIVENYLAAQQEDLANADLNGLVNSWLNSDVVSYINSIEVTGTHDTAYVTVELTTASGEDVALREAL